MREELITKGPEGTWGMMTLFYIFVMVATQLDVMFKMHRALHQAGMFYCGSYTPVNLT